MRKNPKFFVVTHQDLPWDIPFSHERIGVEGYCPPKGSGIAAASVIGRLLDQETAFGALRGLMAANALMAQEEDTAVIFSGTYRLFLGQETNPDWLSPVMQENKIISPEDLQGRWQELILTEMPSDVDIMIPAPRLLPDTVMGQYARVHHLDDLMLAVGCAIRAGLLDPLSVPAMLQSNTLIPYGNFAARKSIKLDFNRKIWNCALDFYKNHHSPRVEYQRRVIDFVFERIASMAIVQMIVNKELRCVSCRNILVSPDGVYQPTL